MARMTCGVTPGKAKVASRAATRTPLTEAGNSRARTETCRTMLMTSLSLAKLLLVVIRKLSRKAVISSLSHNKENRDSSVSMLTANRLLATQATTTGNLVRIRLAAGQVKQSLTAMAGEVVADMVAEKRTGEAALQTMLMTSGEKVRPQAIRIMRRLQAIEEDKHKVIVDIKMLSTNRATTGGRITITNKMTIVEKIATITAATMNSSSRAGLQVTLKTCRLLSEA